MNETEYRVYLLGNPVSVSVLFYALCLLRSLLLSLPKHYISSSGHLVAEHIESSSICCHADSGFFSCTERSQDGGNEEW